MSGFLTRKADSMSGFPWHKPAASQARIVPPSHPTIARGGGVGRVVPALAVQPSAGVLVEFLILAGSLGSVTHRALQQLGRRRLAGLQHRRIGAPGGGLVHLARVLHPELVEILRRRRGRLLRAWPRR